MVIAVYADFKSNSTSDQDVYFIESLIKNLAADKQHQVYLIVPGTIDEFYEEGSAVISLKIKKGLLYRYRLTKKVLKTEKKIKAELILSINAVLKISFPQSLLVTGFKNKNQFTGKSLQNLRSVFALSEPVKTALVEQYKIDPKKINLLFGGPSAIFLPLSDEAKNVIKEKYSEGKEYFIYRGLIKKENNIISLLKGFSLFKKRQKSAMKLLLMGNVEWENNEFEKLLNTYKYREDVIVVPKIKEADQAELLAAAYAFVEPYTGNNLLFAFDAMQCHVPVLSCSSFFLKEIAPDAALYFDSITDTDIANRMMQVYKDETVRNDLIEKGNDFIKRYDWKETRELIWQNLQSS
jgi:hypothetical protein